MSLQAQANQRLLSRIKAIHRASDGVMGAPSMWEQLVYEGERCGRNRVERLMRVHAIQGLPQKKRWQKKGSSNRPEGIANHLARDFKSLEANRKWVSDITYIRTAEHWLYLCVVIDLYSGIVIGWSMQRRQDKDIVTSAVQMAIWHAQPDGGVILHSDRGTQYTSHGYQRFLKENHITSSMSAVGSCADNAAAESFFGLLKRERVHRKRYQTRANARADVFDYIERFHNPRRRRKLALKQAGLLPFS
jgi:putative transposase